MQILVVCMRNLLHSLSVNLKPVTHHKANYTTQPVHESYSNLKVISVIRIWFPSVWLLYSAVSDELPEDNANRGCAKIQGYSKWLSGYNCPVEIPHQIRETTTLTIPFEGGMHSFKRQSACVSRNWRYELEPPLKPSPLTCGTNSIIVLMFVESQRVHI